MASPTPVLPDVGSTIVPPGCSSPEASAASIIRAAIRSFTEPPGLRYSTLASTSGPRSALPSGRSSVPCSRTSGVLPTRSSSDSTYSMRGQHSRGPELVSHRREWPRGRRQPCQPYGARRRSAPRRAPAARGRVDPRRPARGARHGRRPRRPRGPRPGARRPPDAVVRVRPQPVRRAGAGRRGRRGGRPARRPRRRPRHLRLPQPVRRPAGRRGRPSGDPGLEARAPGGRRDRRAERRRPRRRRLRAAGPRSRCWRRDRGPGPAGALLVARRDAVPHRAGRRDHAAAAGLAALVGGRARPRDAARTTPRSRPR